MNLEQSKLTVNGTFNTDGGLLWEKAICSQGWAQVQKSVAEFHEELLKIVSIREVHR